MFCSPVLDFEDVSGVGSSSDFDSGRDRDRDRSVVVTAAAAASVTVTGYACPPEICSTHSEKAVHVRRQAEPQAQRTTPVSAD